MEADFLSVILIFSLILANGFLAMSEIAMVSARKARLQSMVADGEQGAATALRLTESPGRFLSTVQVGITLVGVLTGAIGGATFAEELEVYLRGFPALGRFGEAISVALVSLPITYLSLVLGELVPKRLALLQPERVASRIAPVMNLLALVASPFVSLLTHSTDFVLMLLRARKPEGPSVTEEEVRLLIGEGTEMGVFEPIEEEIVGQIFRLSDRKVSSLITPRSEIVWLDVQEAPEIVQAKISAAGRSYYPVAEGSLDHLVGFVRATDLLARCIEGRPLDLPEAVQPALIVPEHMPAFGLLERLQETGSSVAMVFDEYGGIQGLVSLRDVLEAIMGDIPEPDKLEEPDIVRREDGSWLLDGMLSVDEFRDLFGLGELPGEKEHHYETLGGFVMTSLGRVPSVGEHFEWENLYIEVVDMDRLRVDKILVQVKEAR